MAIGQGGKEGPSRLSRPSLDFVFAHLPRERVAMDAERVGRLRQAAVELAEDARDESFFELVHRVVELHPFVHHFLDELLQPLGDHLFSFRAGAPPPARLLGDSAPRNGSGLSRSLSVRRRNASTYFSRVRATTSDGNDGTGGCLFHRIDSR